MTSTLLIVDDHDMIREGLRYAFAETESELIEASDGAAGLFVDFENLAIGVQDMKSGAFEIRLVLKRLLEKGRIVFNRAYCDWRSYADAVREFHAQGIELIDIPHSKMLDLDGIKAMFDNAKRDHGKTSWDLEDLTDHLDPIPSHLILADKVRQPADGMIEVFLCNTLGSLHGRQQ